MVSTPSVPTTPNSLLQTDPGQTVGKAQAKRDTDDCMALANNYGVSTNKDGEIGKKAATGAALGGIGAGAYGLVRGDAGERALAGAAAGAATGAVKGGIDSTELSPTFKRFVQRFHLNLNTALA